MFRVNCVNRPQPAIVRWTRSGYLNDTDTRFTLRISPQCNFDINTIKVIDKCSGYLKLRFAESIHLKLGKQTLIRDCFSFKK